MTIALVLAAWVAVSVMVSLGLGLMLRGEDEAIDVRDSEQYYAHEAPAGRGAPAAAASPQRVA